MTSPMEKQNTGFLSDSEIKEISSRYIRGCDKWYRMYAGIASDLERYENGIIHLRIKNTENKFSSNYETAIRFARDWFNGNAELKDAKGFVVSFYKTTFTGFSMKGTDIVDNKDLLNDLVQQIRLSNQEEKELVEVFSGLFAGSV